MTSCTRNIHTKNYQNLIIGFQVTVKNVGGAFWGHNVVFEKKQKHIKNEKYTNTEHIYVRKYKQNKF